MMKTKLLALALLGVGSMFAQTRFSINIGTGGYRSGYAQPAYTAAQPYNQAIYRDQDRDDNRFNRGDDRFNRGDDERQNRFGRDRDHDDRDRGREVIRYENGFRNR